MMGGSTIDGDWELTPSSDRVRTVVLVGRTGNGKSATGNSVLGRKTFMSKASSSGITSTCELQQSVLSDGQIINVIDILLDFRTRFSQQEEAALRTLQTLFGNKIIDYTTVVFTGGDELKDQNETLEVYLGCKCPQPLKEILTLCKNRRVLFDNKTQDEFKRAEQVQQLLFYVDMVIVQNNGQPYSHELFIELKKGSMKLHDQREEVRSSKGYSEQQKLELMERVQGEQLKRITEMVESKLRETTTRLEQQLTEERAARLKTEEIAQVAQTKSNDEIRKLRENLERAQRENEELRMRADRCTIL